MRDVEGISVGAEPPGTEEEAHSQHFRIYRESFGVFAFAEPGQKRPGVYRCAATSREAAGNICEQLARDEMFPGKGTNDKRRAGAVKPQHVLEARKDRARVALSTPPKRGRKKFSETVYPCGHPRTLENTYGSRDRARCRTCQQARARARWSNREKGVTP